MMSTVIKRNTTIPCRKEKIFTTEEDNQTEVDVVICEGERVMTKDNNVLGKFTLRGIAPAKRGTPQIAVIFDLDANGILCVSAIDKASNKSGTITITNNKGSLTKEQIERMVQDAEVYKRQDADVRERVEAHNKLENYVFQVRDMLDDELFREKMTVSDRHSIEKVVEDTLNWLDTNLQAPKQVCAEKLRDLEKVVHPVTSRMYTP